MAKGVSTPVGDLDPEGDEPAVGNIIDTSGLHRSAGRMHAQEDLRPGAWRSHQINVAGKPFSNVRYERIHLRLAPLQTEKTKSSCSPVDLVEPQCDHFTAAHAVNGKQQQNGAIPNIPRPVRVGVRQHALHIGPIGRVW